MNQVTLDEFVWLHRNDDPHQLALSGKQHPGISVGQAAAQVKALQKIRTKIPRWYRSGMSFPYTLSVEQSSSEQTAQYKASLFSGQKMADLTGGMGVDAYFFAQQFESLTYIEQKEELAAATKHNFVQLGCSNVQFETQDALHFLQHTAESFDLIYLDPARRDDRKGKVFQLSDCSPNILEIKELVLQKARQVLVKTAPLLDLRQAVLQLENVVQIWVVAAEGECREVLYLLQKEAPPSDQIPITAVHLRGGSQQVFSFDWAAEQAAEVRYSPPQTYLYEPNAAILKAGAFRSFGAQFGLEKLQANTHLYTSAVLQPNVPARSFVVEQVCKYDRKTVQKAVPSGQANIACRNFPDNPEQVRRTLGLRDGGDVYLFAATDMAGNKVILIGKKVP